MRSRLFIVVIVFCVFFSCKKDERRNETEKIVAEWIGKKIIFPLDYECNLMKKDTNLCAGLLDANYKILLYVDSLGCANCKLRLFEWKQLIQEADSIFTENELSFLFFFHPKDKKELRYLFVRYDFDYPVFLDNTNQINSLNHFSNKQLYQCFLLNKENKVMMIGNPLHNPGIWKIYKEQISEKMDN